MRPVTVRLAGVVTAVAGVALLAVSASRSALAAAIAVAALYAAVRMRRQQRLSPRHLCAAFLACGIVGALLVPALLGALHSAEHVMANVEGPHAGGERRAVLAAGVVLVLLLWTLRRWPEKLPEALFLVLLGVPLTIGKLVYVHLVQMEPISDFAAMWALTGEIASAGLPTPATLVEWLYLERVLPYLLPLRVLFGPEPSSYAAANVLVGVASSVGTYFLARRLFGPAAARAAFALSMVAPETWLAAEIPTHDVPGALFLVLGLLILYAVHDRVREGRRSAILWGAGWGLLVVVLDLQRTVGTWFLLTCGTVAAASVLLDPPAPQWRRGALLAIGALLLVPMLTLAAGNWALRAGGLKNSAGDFVREQEPALLMGLTSWSDGLPWNIAAEVSRYRDLPIDWTPIAAAHVASETAWHPLSRLGALVRHSRTLFALGSQTGIYLTPSAIGQRFGQLSVNAIMVASSCFSALFVFLLWRGCWRLASSPLPALSLLVPLAYLAVLAGILILLGQIQPRYLYAIWYLGAIFAGWGLTPARDAIGIQGRRDRVEVEQDAVADRPALDPSPAWAG